MTTALRLSSVVVALLGIAGLAAPQRMPPTTIQAHPSLSQFPDIATDGTNTYVVWSNDTQTRVSRSSDGGGTWSAPALISRFGSCRANDVHVAISAGTVYAVWTDSSGCFSPPWPPYLDQRVRFNNSFTGSSLWFVDRIVSGERAPGFAYTPQLAVDGTNVYVVWSDDRDGAGNVYFNRSMDSGLSWLPEVRLDHDPTTHSVEPRIAASNGSVYVAWIDYRDGGKDVYFNRSVDNGAAWLANDVRLNTGVPGGSHPVSEVRVAVDHGAVCVTWLDSRFGTDIFGNVSLDGTSWLASDVRIGPGSVPGAISCAEPRMARVGSTVHMCWSDNRNGNWNVFTKRSTDGGLTWPGSETRVSTNNQPGRVYLRPVIAATPDVVTVAWASGGAPTGMFSNRSIDGGVSWLPSEVRLDANLPLTFPSFPALAASGTVVRAAWVETSGLDRSIASNLPFGFVDYGAAMLGSGGFAPRLSGSGLPTLGGALTLDVDAGLGGAAGALLVGAGPGSRVSIPLLGGTLLVDPILSLPFVLGGTSPGTGDWALPLPVPSGAELIGLDLNFQALTVDPASPSGIVFTNGLESWID